VALGIGIEDRPFAKSTLQLFRSHLVLHDQIRAVFQKSLALAGETGYLKDWKIKAVLHTSYILGRGAVKDTYNLLADGVVQLVRGLAGAQGIEPAAWAAAHQLSRYFGTSLKGEAAIGWDDPEARRRLLGIMVADADGLLEATRVVLVGWTRKMLRTSVSERRRACWPKCCCRTLSGNPMVPPSKKE
jgi:hypothetical protein